MNVLGIDIGGSGIKGAPVDVTTGEQIAERFRVETPQPATPEAVAEAVAEVAQPLRLAWTHRLHLSGRRPARHRPHRRQRGRLLDRRGRRHTVRTHHRLPRPRPQRRRRRRPRRNDVRRRQAPQRRRHDAHLRHRHRFRHLRGRSPPAQHRARPPADSRQRRRASRRLTHSRGRGPLLEEVGQTRRRVSRTIWSSSSRPICSSSAAASARSTTSSFPYLSTRADIVPAQLLNEAGIIGAAMAARDLASDG